MAVAHYLYKEMIFIIKYNFLGIEKPELIKYLYNKDDAFKFRPYSNTEITVTCPDCGDTFNMWLPNLTRRGFSCRSCGDYISYPNKFLRGFISQIKNQLSYYKFEWSDAWTENLIYDAMFILDGHTYVVEMQGEQHYIDRSMYNITLLDTQQRDEYKLKLAIKNNCTPIIIDARESNKDYISNNIKNSILNNLFDLSKIDWNLCDMFTSKNIHKEICLKYENGMIISDIAREYNLNRCTVRDYLKRGTNCGWCNYNPNSSQEKLVKRISMPVSVYDANNNLLFNAPSIKETSIILKRDYNFDVSVFVIKTYARDTPEKLYKQFYFKFS